MVKTLLKSVRQYKRVSIETPLFVTMEVILECTIPLIMSKLIDDMTGTSMAPILKYGALLLVLATLSLLFGVLSARAAATAGCGLAKNLRRDLYFKTQDFAFADIDKFSSSSLVTRMTTDVSNVQNAYQMLIRMAVRAPLMTVFSVIMSMSINVRMSFIFLALLPVLAAALFGIFFYVHPIFKRIFKKYDALNNSVQENVGGIRVVKSFVREDYEKEKFENAAEEVRKDFTMAEKILALNNPVMTFCINAFSKLFRREAHHRHRRQRAFHRGTFFPDQLRRPDPHVHDDAVHGIRYVQHGPGIRRPYCRSPES